MGSRLADLIWQAVVVAEVAFVLASAAHARRHAAHLAVLCAAVYVLVADVAMKALQVFVLRDAEGGTRPLVGLTLVAYHVEAALFTGWPAAVALLGAWVFLPQSRRKQASRVVGVWLGVNVALAVAGPVAGTTTTNVYRVAELAAVGAVGVSAVLGWPRTIGTHHAVALFLAGAELVVVMFGPYATDIYEDWSLATLLYAVAFAGLAVWYVWVGRARRVDPAPLTE